MDTLSLVEETDECWENNRFYSVFIGWSARLLPTDRTRYSNKSGDTEIDMENFPLPSADWTWAGNWCDGDVCQ